MSPEEITLRELIETRLEALEELTEARFAAEKKALELKAEEYKRSLESLNHEVSRLREIQTTYLPREVYDCDHRELVEKVNALMLEAKQSAGKSSGISAAWLVIVVVSGLAISIAGLVISVAR